MRFLILLTALAAAPSHAALLGRAPLTPGGTDYQAYYDDALNITWTADANLAATTTFGVIGIDSVGRMQWQTALNWIEGMNAASYLNINSWRLPKVSDTGLPGCDSAPGGGTSTSGGDCGWNVDLATGEMAYMYYSTLGNAGQYDVNGTRSELCQGNNLPDSCMTNQGPFENIQTWTYWYQTTDASSDNDAWVFAMYLGYQHVFNMDNPLNAWAVHDGDPLAVVPIPAAVWLLGSALGVMGWMRRKAAP
jgi:hypothetical protein